MSRLWMWAGCAVMVLGLGYLLWSSGYSNLLVYGMLLLCPLMHLFMHKGHGHGGTRDDQDAAAGDQPGGKKPSCH